MLQRIVAMCVLLAVAAPLSADTTVRHVAGQTSGWRGSYNNSASYCWLNGWANSGADACIAGFDRTALTTAINNQVTTSGGWNAKLVVTQIEWEGNPAIPADLGPVAGVIDVDTTNFAWGHVSDGAPSAFNAGNGNWYFGGSSHPNFVSAYNASAAAGKSFLFSASAAQWSTFLDPTLANPNVINMAIDVPESLVVRYLNNAAAEGLFVSATKASPGLKIYQGDQWGGSADLRVLITAPPAGVPWLNGSVLYVNRIVALTSPTYSQSVTVTNAGTGTIAWTASESPAVGWVSLGTPSGASGGTFSIDIDVTGLAVGTYTTDVVVSDTGAGNSLTIPVTATVVATAQPIISLSATTMTFTARPSDATVPPAQTVTVKNIGLGTLAWTAAENPNQTWMTVVIGAGGNNAPLSISVDHRGLPSNVYTGTVQVTDPSAQNSPQNLTVKLIVRDQDADIVKANSYDDAWEADANGWAAQMWHMRLNATGKTAGFVTLCGDSITYANPFGQWPRYGAGKTPADNTICTWMNVSHWPGGGNNSPNGWYLAAFDARSGGSYTAKSGITAGQYLGGTAGLPSFDQMFTTGFTNPDGKQYRDALMCVILLGTNDIGGGNTAGLTSNLTAMVDKLEASKIIPILTTLPPRVGSDTTVGNFNTAIRNLAQSRKLPLIDYWAEIIRRRPGDSWQNTLISNDSVHPSASGGAYSSSSDPYASSGAALSEVGYLLRSWLTVQKIAEVKAKVLDKRTGDIDGDGHCDVVDLLTLAASWPLSMGDANYDQRCDFNGDNMIDVEDLMTLAENFGDF